MFVSQCVCLLVLNCRAGKKKKQQILFPLVRIHFTLSLVALSLSSFTLVAMLSPLDGVSVPAPSPSPSPAAAAAMEDVPQSTLASSSSATPHATRAPPLSAEGERVEFSRLWDARLKKGALFAVIPAKWYTAHTRTAGQRQRRGRTGSNNTRSQSYILMRLTLRL